MAKFTLSPATLESAQAHIAACAREHGFYKISGEAARFFNAEHAEVHPDGDVYIEQPMRGHYLSTSGNGEEKLVRFAEALENGF